MRGLSLLLLLLGFNEKERENEEFLRIAGYINTLEVSFPSNNVQLISQTAERRAADAFCSLHMGERESFGIYRSARVRWLYGLPSRGCVQRVHIDWRIYLPDDLRRCACLYVYVRHHSVLEDRWINPCGFI